MEIELEEQRPQNQIVEHKHLKYNHKRAKSKRAPQIDDASVGSDEEEFIAKINALKKVEKTSDIGRFKYLGPQGRVKPVDSYITIVTILMISAPTLAFFVFMYGFILLNLKEVCLRITAIRS
jgi:hypothetical protein